MNEEVKSPPKDRLDSAKRADQPMAEKILIWIFVVLIIASIGVTFWRIMIRKDYIISVQTDCDPYSAKCFVWECVLGSTIEGEACTGDKTKDVWHYQIMERKAFNIPLCDPKDENCEALVCPEGEADCEIIFCDEANKEEQGVECNDPVKFTVENPMEEVLCDPEAQGECALPAEQNS